MASNNDKISVAVEPQAIATGEDKMLSEQMTAAFDRMQEQVDLLKKEFSYLSQQNLSMYTATVDFIRKSVNGLNDSLSEELRGLKEDAKTAQAQNVIDYDLLAEKVAEKLRAAQELPAVEVDTEEFSSRLAEKMTLPPVEVDFEQLAQGIADRLTLPDVTIPEEKFTMPDIEVDADALAEKVADKVAEKVEEKVNVTVKTEEPDHDAIVGYILEALPSLDYHLLAQNLAAELNNKSEEAVENYVAAYEEEEPAKEAEATEEVVEEVAEPAEAEEPVEVEEVEATEEVEPAEEEPAEEPAEEVSVEAEELKAEDVDDVIEEPVQELVEEPAEEDVIEAIAEEPEEIDESDAIEEIAEVPEEIDEAEVIDDADEPVIELFDESEEAVAVAEAEEPEEAVEEPAEDVAEAAAEEEDEQEEESATDPFVAAEEEEDVTERDGETVKDSATSILTAAGGTTIRLKRSYECKLRQSSDELKYYYGDLKNNLLSYEKVKSNMSWNGDRYNYGRVTVVKMNIVGKTLCIYLALNPDDYSLTKYHQKYAGNVKTYESTPMMVKVKSHMGLKRATSLIGDMMDSFGAKKLDKAPVDYAEIYTYMTDDEMLASGQIKASITKKKDLNSF
jgi:hypothetical protein